MAEECVHNTALCCASVGYGPYQNITNLGVLIPSIFDAVRRIWLKKVSGGGASKPFLGVSSINQQQNIKMLTRCCAVLCCAVLFAPSLASGFAPQGRAQVRDREYNWSDLLDWDGKHDGGSGDGHELR